MVGFVHHPLAMETGLDPAAATRYAALETRLWPMMRGIVCPSASAGKAVAAAGVATDRIEIAPPGTARPAVIGKRAAEGALRLLAVGAITPRKGHLLLVAALGGLRDLDWRLTCIGSTVRDPGAAAALRGAIGERGLGERITLLGEQPQAALAAAYRDADLFVLPSYHEGYGMACVEALAHGLPVIATTAGAIPETVAADASLLVAPGDEAALRAALRRALGDASLRARLAGQALAAAAALPDWPAAVRRWASAVDRLAA